MAKPWEGKWEEGERLAGGGHGWTHLARRVGDAEWKYVVKELKQQNIADRRARFAREVSIYGKLDHPNIAKCVDSNAEKWDSKEHLYLVTEFVEGPTLNKLLEGRPMALEVAGDLMQKLLDVVDHCHQREVSHRDIKPENIILRSGDPKAPVLLDFGLSFNEDADPEGFQTRGSEAIGNRFLYLPEYQASGADRRDLRSDIAQCVGVLFFIVTGQSPSVLTDGYGRKPHDREPAAATIASLGGEAAGKLRNIFDQGFEHSLTRRWQSTDNLRSAILALTQLGKPGQKIRKPFGEVLEDLHRQTLEEPEYKTAEAFDKLANECSATFTRLHGEVIKKFDTMQRTGGTLISIPNGVRQLGTFNLKRKHGGDRVAKFIVCAERRESEIILLAGERLDVLVRRGIFDLDVRQALADAIEDCFAETIRQLVRS